MRAPAEFEALPAYRYAVYAEGNAILTCRFYRESEALSEIALHGKRISFLPEGRVLRLRFSLAGEEFILLVLLPPDEEADPTATEAECARITDAFRRVLMLTEPRFVCKSTLSQRMLFSLLTETLTEQISDRITADAPACTDEWASLDVRGFVGAVTLLLAHATATSRTRCHLSLVSNGAGEHAVCFTLPQNARNAFLEKLVGEIARVHGFSFSSADGEMRISFAVFEPVVSSTRKALIPGTPSNKSQK